MEFLNMYLAKIPFSAILKHQIITNDPSLKRRKIGEYYKSTGTEVFQKYRGLNLKIKIFFDF